jgi:chromosome segregation ATPase
MTEVTEQWHDVGVEDHETDRGPGGGGGFVDMANALHVESERLIALAEACRSRATQLEEHEARLAERERELAHAREELDARAAELERWKGELDELRTRADEANARIVEAAEREAALRAMAHGVLERYTGQPSSSDA